MHSYDYIVISVFVVMIMTLYYSNVFYEDYHSTPIPAAYVYCLNHRTPACTTESDMFI